MLPWLASGRIETQTPYGNSFSEHGMPTAGSISAGRINFVILTSCQAGQMEECKEESIERPMAVKTKVRLDTFAKCDIRKDWSYLPIRRFWTIGYNQTALSRWFEMIPADIGFLLQRLIARVEDEMLSRIMHLKFIEGLRTRASTDLDDAGLITEQGFWDGDETCPHFAIRYDPVTQQRTNIYANKKLASLVGFHIEEYLSRLAAYDMEIPVPLEDFLYIVIDEILSIPVNKKELYLRLLSRKCSQQGILVVITNMKTFNSAGEITQVNCGLVLPILCLSILTVIPSGAADIQSHNSRRVRLRDKERPAPLPALRHG
jgi:hypothetical protein